MSRISSANKAAVNVLPDRRVSGGDKPKQEVLLHRDGCLCSCWMNSLIYATLLLFNVKFWLNYRKAG